MALSTPRLGDFLLKKRVGAPGRGESGSYRTIAGHRQADRLIFVHGFAKNEADNIKKSQKTALRKLCDIYMGADDKKLAEMVGKNAYWRLNATTRILKNVHKSAERLHEAGFVDDVTMREFDALCLPPLRDYSPDEIKKIRAGTKASQAVFASFINVKKITVAAWEQGTKRA